MPLSAADYRPRDAEHAVLYRVIDEHLEVFLETARRNADGSPLPEFVEQEFRDFLTCDCSGSSAREWVFLIEGEESREENHARKFT